MIGAALKGASSDGFWSVDASVFVAAAAVVITAVSFIWQARNARLQRNHEADQAERERLFHARADVYVAIIDAVERQYFAAIRRIPGVTVEGPEPPSIDEEDVWSRWAKIEVFGTDEVRGCLVDFYKRAFELEDVLSEEGVARSDRVVLPTPRAELAYERLKAAFESTREQIRSDLT